MCAVRSDLAFLDGHRLAVYSSNGCPDCTRLKQSMKLAGNVFTINMVQALGLNDSQGMFAVTPFYWDMNDGTRDFGN